MSERRRVVITGMGALTSLGSDVESTWKAVVAAKSGVRKILQFPSDEFPVNIGSEVDVEQLDIRGVDDWVRPFVTRSVTLGARALTEAWTQAGIAPGYHDPWRSGLLVGASNFPVIDESEYSWPTEALNVDHYKDQYLAICEDMPHLLAQREIGMVSTMLAAPYPIKGPCMTVQAACASATQAVGEAFQMIRHGHADLMAAGGADSMLSPVCVTGFTLLNATSMHRGDPRDACRPFDRKRDGLVLGEGAGIVILESLEDARQRGVPVLAEVVGYGSSTDGYRFTDSHPEGRGAAACMRAALGDAGLEPGDVDYINAHGTGTPQNDRAETIAIKLVFGDDAYTTPVSSSKSELGHLLCAAGGVELVLTVQALRTGIVPPTINLENPDPDCDLDYVPNVARKVDPEVALSNSFGFGGQNGTLIVRRFDPAAEAVDSRSCGTEHQ